MIRASRRATVSIAREGATDSKAPFPSRTIADRSRVATSTVCATLPPLGQSFPKLAGCFGSPRTLEIATPSLDASNPHPTPQYGQTVLISLDMGELIHIPLIP